MLDYEGRYIPEGESYKGDENKKKWYDIPERNKDFFEHYAFPTTGVLIGCSFAVVLLAWAGQIAAMW